MAQHFQDVPKNKRYSEDEFCEIVNVLARILHGNADYATICEVAGTYKESLQLVKLCHDKPHKELIESLVHAEYPLPGEGDYKKKIESCKEYKDYLMKSSELQVELEDLEKVNILVDDKLNPLFLQNFDYIQKIDPDKFEGSVQQKRVDRAKGAYEIQKRNQISFERGMKKFDT